MRNIKEKKEVWGLKLAEMTSKSSPNRSLAILKVQNYIPKI